MSEFRASPEFSAQELDALLAEASFRCEQVMFRRIDPPWIPISFRSSTDKLYAVTAGQGWLRLNDRVYQMRQGDVFLFPIHTVQQGESLAEDPLTKYWIHFDSISSGTMQLLNLCRPAEAFRGQTAARMQALTAQLLDEYEHVALARQLAVKTLIMQILVEAYRAPECDIRPPDRYFKEHQHHEPEKKSIQSKRIPTGQIRKSIATIVSRFREPLTLNELAECACLHPTHFAQTFKTIVGMPPMKFLEQYRLGRAKELLSRTDLPVHKVAQESGYPDPYYFSRVFRRLTGVTPSRYREESAPDART